MSRIAVLDDYQQFASTAADWSAVPGEVVFFSDHLTDADALVARLRNFDVIVLMRERTPVPRSLIERLPELRLIVTAGMRNASVDMVAAAERGVTVCGTDSGGGPATAELTWGLILDLLRNITAEDAATRAGRWQTTVGLELQGQTLGLLGLGRLGSAVAKVGRAFGMDVIAWSQNLTGDRAEAVGVTRVERAELLAASDVLSVHVVLSDRTRGLIGAAELAAMKPTAYLVNTSRGPIVDEAALVDALHSGQIAGAGLDVFDQEPLPAGHPLLTAPHTVLTPHIGFVTEQTYREWYPAMVEGIAAFLAGTPIRVLN
ncbi:MAG TPA: D-2-hydroxyacid dehydrogenase family protein [Mycobacteriales bacterium]|nr:D-2-hydroxyacid dehydrogenase family protein [Mycobacteriales bacterium]